MLRKQRKLQPWRRFGYVILIIIKFDELLLWFSPRIMVWEAISNIRKDVSFDIQTPCNWLKKNSAAPRGFNHLSVFRYRMKHSSACLIYYFSCEKTLSFKFLFFVYLFVCLFTSSLVACSRRLCCARLKKWGKSEKYPITWQHNYHRAAIHLAMYGLYDL